MRRVKDRSFTIILLCYSMYPCKGRGRIETDRRIFWVVNPACGNGAGERRWLALEKALRNKGLIVNAGLTTGPNHATVISRSALYEGYDHIIVVGGDGTINETINGFYHENTDERINSAAVFSVIPSGSGCDFTRMLGLTSNLKEILSICQGGREMPCDLVRATYSNWSGQAENRFFVNVADLGLGCEIALRVNQQGKRWGGFLSFLITTLTTLAKVECKPVCMQVDGQEVFAGMANLIAVANGQYFGGGMKIAPAARLDDGLLDIIVLHGLKRGELIANLPKVYSGSHLTHPKVSLHRGRLVSITSADNLCLELDGETPGTGNCQFEVLSAELTLVVPKVFNN